MRYIASVAALLFSLPSFSAPELKGHPDELRAFIHPHKRTVSISDSASTKAYTDKAIVSLVVTTEEDKMADALEKNAQIRKSIIDALIKAGMKTENIKNSKFSSSPQYGWFGDEPDSFEISNRMALSVLEEKHMKKIAELADGSKAIQFAETEFEHTEKEAFKKQVKKDALKKIMQQKADYEAALGIKLKAVSFHNPHIMYGATRGAKALEEKIVITGSRISAKSRYKSKGQSADSFEAAPPQRPSTSFDEVEYKAEMTVVFEVVE